MGLQWWYPNPYPLLPSLQPLEALNWWEGRASGRDRKHRERATQRHYLKHNQAGTRGHVEEVYKAAVPAGGLGAGVSGVEQGNLAGDRAADCR